MGHNYPKSLICCSTLIDHAGQHLKQNCSNVRDQKGRQNHESTARVMKFYDQRDQRRKTFRYRNTEDDWGVKHSAKQNSQRNSSWPAGTTQAVLPVLPRPQASADLIIYSDRRSITQPRFPDRIPYVCSWTSIENIKPNQTGLTGWPFQLKGTPG